jgi:hypothetical protein
VSDVWLLIVNDRHFDMRTEVCTNKAIALGAAEEALVEYGEDRGGYNRDPDEFEWSDPTDDRPFAVRYSCEGDWIEVRRVALNEGQP